MTNKGLVGLLLVAAIIILFLLLYLFYPRGLPQPGLEKTKEPAVKTQVTPAPKEKPGEKAAPAPTPVPTPAPAPAPAPQEQPQKPPPPPAAPPEKPLTKPEAPAAAPQETVLPPLKPKEEFGLLVGSYRRYHSAGKRLEKLKKQGHEAFIRRERGKYQVLVGPFPTRKEAQAAAKSLKAKMRISSKIKKLVIPVPK
jgi:cell division septation protein DedD